MSTPVPDEQLKIARKVPRDVVEQRIEDVRRLIRVNMNTGDMKRTCSRQWKIKPRAVERYITEARNRNREVLDTDEDQNLSDSLSYWSKRQQEAEVKLQKERAAGQSASEEYESARLQIAELEALDEDEKKKNPAALEQLERLEMKRENALRRLNIAHQLEERAQFESTGCQDRIDKLKGNFAPIKIARTKADGTDISDKSKEERLEEMRRLGMLPAPRLLEAKGRVISTGPAEQSPTVIENATNGHAGNGHVGNGKSDGKTNGKPIVVSSPGPVESAKSAELPPAPPLSPSETDDLFFSTGGDSN